MKVIDKLLVTYAATVIGVGLSLFSYSRIVTYTYVPEIRLTYETPPAISSIGICMDCKFKPWQRVLVGKTLPGRDWTVKDITVRLNSDGLGGEIYGSCKDEK